MMSSSRQWITSSRVSSAQSSGNWPHQNDWFCGIKPYQKRGGFNTRTNKTKARLSDALCFSALPNGVHLRPELAVVPVLFGTGFQLDGALLRLVELLTLRAPETSLSVLEDQFHWLSPAFLAVYRRVTNIGPGEVRPPRPPQMSLFSTMVQPGSQPSALQSLWG